MFTVTPEYYVNIGLIFFRMLYLPLIPINNELPESKSFFNKPEKCTSQST